MDIKTIGDAYFDNDGNIIIRDWEFGDAGPDAGEFRDLVGIAGEAGQLQGFCFFCHAPLIQEGRFNKSIGEKFQERFNQVPNNLVGRIGHKAVCHKCKIDIEQVVIPTHS